MTKNEPLSAEYRKVLEQLRFLEVGQLIDFCSMEPTNKNERDRQRRAILLIYEALESLRFAQLQIK